ncbi:MAG: hypothetical protein K1X78_01610 [Verrucomicrobiaceae bacterium]|nr:hypothetical protein [Verrucomicrobiaceae bacterium]
MKTNILLTTIVTLALSVAARAESTLVIKGVHNCCAKCDKGIVAAVAKVDGATAKTNKGEVTITAKTDADAKKAFEALAAAGYYGSGAGDAAPTADSAKVTSATVDGVHLCCGKCADAANKAAKMAPGVTNSSAAKGDTSFKVEGNFSKGDLLAALRKCGLNGTIK